MDKFGILAVRNAWYDPSKVTDHVIQGYTKVTIYFWKFCNYRVLMQKLKTMSFLQPLRSRGWEMALLEYTISMIMDSISSSKVPVSERLSEISCPGFHIHYTFGILQWYTNKQKKKNYLLSMFEFAFRFTSELSLFWTNGWNYLACGW